MDFKQLQNKVFKNAVKYGKKYKIEIDEDFALLKLFEEMGEFSQAILIHRKKSRPEKHLPVKASKEALAEELADILGLTIVNAKLLGIDLEKALTKKWINR